MIDIAAHIVASAKLGQPKSAGDLFVILAKAKILDQKLSQRLTQAVGFRNILVHQYSDIDYHLAYSDLKRKLKDLRDFAERINNYLRK